MLRSVELQDYMLTDPIKVKSEDDIFDAIHLILMYRVSGVCVVDYQNNLVGMLSEMDCLKGILNGVYNESPHAGKVEEHMTKEVVTVNLHENIVDVATDMLKHKQRRRPVVQDGKLIGQISCRQLLRAVKEFASPVDASEH